MICAIIFASTRSYCPCLRAASSSLNTPSTTLIRSRESFMAVGKGALGRDAAVIDGIHMRRAKLCSSQRQNARSRTDIQHAHPWLDILLKQFQAHACSWMQPGAKSHAGIERQDNVVRLGFIGTPGRSNDDMLSYMSNVEVFFPGIGPVLFVDRSRM